jgi:hypothetical protein
VPSLHFARSPVELPQRLGLSVEQQLLLRTPLRELKGAVPLLTGLAREQ